MNIEKIVNSSKKCLLFSYKYVKNMFNVNLAVLTAVIKEK